SRTPAFVELIHSQTVYDVPDAAAVSALCGAQGDGIISPDRSLVPVVTVADCMPLYLYDRRTGVFGAFHSGWKGTGIIGAGIALAESHYGVRREEVCVAIGAHIQDCCYVVDEERAAYFADNFTPKAVRSLHEFNAAGKRLYSLSLLEANLAVLKDAGVRSCNIVAATDCTCCTTSGGVRSLPGDAGHAGAEACSAGHAGAKIAGKAPVSAALAEKALSSYYPFGSFRREAAFMPPELTAEKRSRLMTVQAAFCIWL
ncbi:MAG: polyphenol oxidase family protein, partial [Treponema sp.]|nr:polyphenol oxidase family protein [Treponema sp.]